MNIVSNDPSAGMQERTRGPRPRYTKLGYLALNVSDIARSRDFYERVMGLEVSGTGPSGEVFLRCSDDHHNVVLYPAAKPGLRRIAWQVEDEEQLDLVAEVARSIDAAVTQVAEDELQALQQGRTIRFRDPFTRATLEFYATQSKEAAYAPTVAQIQRLGHVVLMTDRYDDALGFYLDQLNFRASDAIGNRITFMRCFPNPFHHSFGLGNGKAPGFHHVNFMVSEIDDIGKAIWRFRQNEADVVYGPGRHPPSNSVFIYANDPDGMTVEYSYGMEEFPEEGAREPRALPMTQDSSDTWGAPPPRIQPVLIETDEEVDLAARTSSIA